MAIENSVLMISYYTYTLLMYLTYATANYY
jgi:hypothetical protein